MAADFCLLFQYATFPKWHSFFSSLVPKKCLEMAKKTADLLKVSQPHSALLAFGMEFVLGDGGAL
jgi:hypothetical protein